VEVIEGVEVEANGDVLEIGQTNDGEVAIDKPIVSLVGVI